jgi:hypothetical protein
MGRSSNTTVQEAKIPAWAEAAAQDVLSRAKDVSRIPYAPYYGPDVAAMTPMQIASMQGTNQMAAAFGAPTADVMAGAPTAQTYDGMSAYSSGSLYDAALAELERRQPGTYAALRAPFLNPMTGARPADTYAYNALTGAGSASAAAPVSAAVTREYGGGRDSYGPAAAGGRGTTSMASLGSYAPGGVNTANPASLGNRVAASLSGPQGKPTAADRPVSRSSAAGGGSGGMGGGK